MRYQGVNSDGEPLSSMYVERPAEIDYSSDVGGPSLTRQEFADECDINKIMAQYERTGTVSHQNQRAPMYLDLESVPDLAEALRIVDEAQIAFMSLPATVRREFDNDPVKFVAYVQNGDDEALKRMREWGLAEPEKVEEPPMRVEVINPTPAPETPAK